MREKPEKKTFYDKSDQSNWGDIYKQLDMSSCNVYNKACDDWQAYHTQALAEQAEKHGEIVELHLKELEGICQHLGQSEISIKLYQCWLKLYQAKKKIMEGVG